MQKTTNFWKTKHTNVKFLLITGWEKQNEHHIKKTYSSIISKKLGHAKQKTQAKLQKKNSYVT